MFYGWQRGSCPFGTAERRSFGIRMFALPKLLDLQGQPDLGTLVPLGENDVGSPHARNHTLQSVPTDMSFMSMCAPKHGYFYTEFTGAHVCTFPQTLPNVRAHTQCPHLTTHVRVHAMQDVQECPHCCVLVSFGLQSLQY